MLVTEFCKRFYFARYPKEIYAVGLELCGTRVMDISPFVRNLYILLVVFAYGYLSTWVLTEVTKNFVGELRPHFLAVCQPSVDCATLSSSLYQFNTYLQFGTNYTCTNTDDAAVREARRSFFSGHTSPLFFGFGWLIMYIHVAWSWRHLGIVGHLLQTGLAILGLYVGYTRISDFHHHWHDVFIGGVVGSLIAFATFKFILNWQQYSPKFLPYTASIGRIKTATDNFSPHTMSHQFEVADSDLDVGSEHLQQIPLIRQQTSSSTSTERMASDRTGRQNYREDSHEDQQLHTLDYSQRSRRAVIQPVSLLKVFSDVTAFVVVLVAWLLLKYLVKPVRRAFLCSDMSLYHPEPAKKVFPVWLLVICAIGVPLVIMIVSECIRWFYFVRTRAKKFVYEFKVCSKVYRIPELAGNLYIIIGVFLFASCANSFLTNVGKVSVGRFRPHFIPSCFHNYSYNGFCLDPNQWISDYTCVGESSSILKEKDGAYDIRQSFPSGHSSTAFCGLIFLALYIHKVWNYRNFGLIPYLMELLSFALASYIGITRVTDNRHHPTDVLAGAILGTAIAIIGFRYMVNSFKRSVLVKSEDESDNCY